MRRNHSSPTTPRLALFGALLGTASPLACGGPVPASDDGVFEAVLSETEDAVLGPIAVRSFTLLDAATQQPIRGLEAVSTDQTLNLRSLPARIAIRANTAPSPVGSVELRWDGALERVENLLPYSIAGDTNGQLAPFAIGVGSHTLSATPYSARLAAGTAGASLTVRFSVTDSAPANPAVVTHYVSPSGDDAKDGRTIATAWRTLGRVSSATLKPPAVAGGEVRVLLEGGKTFTGTLKLDTADRGPITVGSYGTGRAVIDAGTGTGVRLLGMADVTVRDLVIRGSGATNRGTGIWATNLNHVLGYVRVRGVKVSGFFEGVSNGKVAGAAGFGIMVSAYGTGSYREVDIRDSEVHGNGTGGIATQSDYPAKTIGVVNVVNNLVYDNLGIPGVTANHTGDGIVIGGALSGSIERNVAHHNGLLCQSTYAGPVGIWAWSSSHMVIQHNESHHNSSASGADGGGFDLDGSVDNSVLQYNYSHHNGGAGYLLADFGSTRGKHRDNIVRYNVSHDDGLNPRSGQGGIHFWANGGADITNLAVYGNTIINRRRGAVTYSSGTFANVVFRNNLFVTGPRGTATVPVIKFKSGSGNLFQANAYVALDQPLQIVDSGTTYAGVHAWQTAKAQEKIDGAFIDLTGRTALPALTGFAGAAALLGDARTLADVDDFGPLAAYRPGLTSPLRGRGLNMIQRGEDVAEDLLGTALRPETVFDIGAVQTAR